MGHFVAKIVMPSCGTYECFRNAMLWAVSSQVDVAIALERSALHGSKALGAKRSRRLEDAVAGVLGKMLRAGLSSHQPRRPVAGATPQRKKRRQDQGCQLIAGQSEPNRWFGAYEFGGETVDEVGDQIEADEVAPKKPASLQLPQDERSREVEG